MGGKNLRVAAIGFWYNFFILPLLMGEEEINLK
jgi:hypothetical protein